MPLPTVQVKAQLNFADGLEAEGVHVIAELQSPSQYDDGYVIQKTIKGNVDAAGCVVLDLWPNDSGKVDSFYKITAYDDILGELLHVVAVVPESAIQLNLEDIAMPVKSFSLANASGNVNSIRRVDTDEGIAGGGDFTLNRTHTLDLTTISTEATDPTTDWIVAVQDPATPGAIRWANLGNLPGVGSDTYETSFAVAGQTEILLEASLGATASALDLHINGKFQCPSNYTIEAIVQDPFFTKIVLGEALEGGEELCVRVKQQASLGVGVDSGDVTYSGGGSVEDALNTLFSQSSANPWQEQSTDFVTTPGDQIFVSTNTGSVNVTLPASPNVGDTIKIIDVTSFAFTGPGNSLLNDFTILRNGSLIMELAEDLIVDQAKVSLEFIYSGATIGWVFSE